MNTTTYTTPQCNIRDKQRPARQRRQRQTTSAWTETMHRTLSRVPELIVDSHRCVLTLVMIAVMIWCGVGSVWGEDQTIYQWSIPTTALSESENTTATYDGALGTVTATYNYGSGYWALDANGSYLRFGSSQSSLTVALPTGVAFQAGDIITYSFQDGSKDKITYPVFTSGSITIEGEKDSDASIKGTHNNATITIGSETGQFNIAGLTSFTITRGGGGTVDLRALTVTRPASGGSTPTYSSLDDVKTATSAPFGFATATSRSDAGVSAVTGGGMYDPQTIINALPSGWGYGTSYTLSSNSKKVIVLSPTAGDDMATTVTSAISDNDIIVFDGTGTTDFTIGSVMQLNDVSDKTILGINGARLCTKWQLTSDDQTAITDAGYASKDPNTKVDYNGVSVDETEECTRTVLSQRYATGDFANEGYRKAGVFEFTGGSNIIIRNLVFDGPGACDVGGYDLLAFKGTTHAWVDHCEFIDGIDGNFDITNAADFITVSWNKFHYTGKSYAHQNCNLVGSSDSNSSDEGKLNITWAYNQWGDSCNARMPMVRYGKIHLLNNYYTCYNSTTGKKNSTSCVNPRTSSEVLLDANHWISGITKIFEPGTDTKAPTAYTWSSTNVIKGTAQDGCGAPSADLGTVTVPYDYSSLVLDPESLTTAIPDNAGATLTYSEKPEVPADPTFDSTNNYWVLGKYADGVDVTDKRRGNALILALEYVKTHGAASSSKATVSGMRKVEPVISGTNKTIYLANGTYDLGTAYGTEVAEGIKLIGESEAGVLIKNAPESESINATSTFTVTGANVTFENLTIKCRAPYSTENKAERGVCVEDKGSNTKYTSVTMDGLQDTYYSHGSAGMTATFDNCTVMGNVDFFCGTGDITVKNSTLKVVPTHASGGHPIICAPATYTTGETQGYLFDGCTVEAASATDCSGHSSETTVAENYYLARGWYNGNGTDKTPRVTFQNMTLKVKYKEQWGPDIVGSKGKGGDRVFTFVGDAEAQSTLDVVNEPYGYAAYFSRNKVATEAERTVTVKGIPISKVTGGGVYTIEAAEAVLNGQDDNTTVTGADGKKYIRLVANTMTKGTLQFQSVEDHSKYDNVECLDPTILKAIEENDVILFDGKGGDFEFYNYILLKELANKTLLGTNNARLTTHWYMTPTVKAMLDQLNVKNASTTAATSTGGTITDPRTGKEYTVEEDAEYLTRAVILDNVGNEDYRNSGIFNIIRCANFVIRNLKFVGPGSCDCAGFDLTTLENSKYFWIDHCEFIDGIDGCLDIKRQSDFVTVSWTKYYYTDRSYVHQNTDLIGHQDDNYSQSGWNFDTWTADASNLSTNDDGKLNITWAYDNWGANCHERMPMLRYGKNHILNCYYSSTMQGTKAVDARYKSEMLLEKSYFVSAIAKKFSTTNAKAYTVKDNSNLSNTSLNYDAEVDGSVEVTAPYEQLPYLKADDVPGQIGSGSGANIGSSMTVVICDSTDNTVSAHQAADGNWYLGAEDEAHLLPTTTLDGSTVPALPLFVTGVGQRAGYMKITGNNLASGTYDINQYLPGLDVQPSEITVHDDGRVYKLDSNGNHTEEEGQLFRFEYTPDRDREQNFYNINFVIGNQTKTIPVAYGRASDLPVITTDLKDSYQIVPGKSHTLTIGMESTTGCSYQWYKTSSKPTLTDGATPTLPSGLTQIGKDSISCDYDMEAGTAAGTKEYVFCAVTKNSYTTFSNVAEFTAVGKFNLIDYEGSYQEITAADLPEGVGVSGTTKINSIAINKGQTAYYAPKLGNNYWTASTTTFAQNTVDLSYCGGFREGDVIKVWGYISNNNPYSDSNTKGKYGAPEIFTRDPSAATTVQGTVLKGCETGDAFINVNNCQYGVEGDPNYPTEEMLSTSKPTPVANNCVTYTLTADDEATIRANGGLLYLGRRVGGTGISISKITVTRGSSTDAEIANSLTNPLTYEAYSYSTDEQKRSFRLTGQALTASTTVTITGLPDDGSVTLDPSTITTDESGAIDKIISVIYHPDKANGANDNTITFAVDGQSTSISVKASKPAKRSDLTERTVTGNISWDFANASDQTIKLTGTTSPTSSESFNLATLGEIQNDNTFLSDYFTFSGSYPVYLASDNIGYAVAKDLTFTAGVDGTVEVVFGSDAGDDVALMVNGKYSGSHSSSTETDKATTSRKVQITIPDGESSATVHLSANLVTNVQEDSTATAGAVAQSVRIYSVKFEKDPTVAPVIETDLSATYNVAVDSVFTMTCVASNVRNYNWYRNITGTVDTSVDTHLDVTGDAFTYKATEDDMTRPFYIYCIADNVVGTDTSTVAKVTVSQKGSGQKAGTDYFIKFDDWDLVATPTADMEKTYTDINDKVIVKYSTAMAMTDSKKTFGDADNTALTRRLQYKTTSYVDFPVEGACNISVYWVAGDANRRMQLTASDGVTVLAKDDATYTKNQTVVSVFKYTGKKDRLRMYSPVNNNYLYGIKIEYTGSTPTTTYMWNMADWTDLQPDDPSATDANTNSAAKFPEDGTYCQHAAKSADGTKTYNDELMYYRGGKGNSYMVKEQKTVGNITWTYKLNTYGKTVDITSDGKTASHNYFLYNAPGKGTLTVYGNFDQEDSTLVYIRADRMVDDSKVNKTYSEKAKGTFTATYTIPAAGPVYIWFPTYKVEIYGISAEIEQGTTVTADKPTAKCGLYNVNTKQYAVTLSNTLEDSKIYYTTDGSDPTTSSSSIDAAETTPWCPTSTINVGYGTTVKAITVKSGYENSDVTSYTAPDEPAPQDSVLTNGTAYISGGAVSNSDYIDIAYTIHGTYVAGTSTVGNDKAACVKLRAMGEKLEKIGGSTPTNYGITINVNPGYVITRVDVVSANSNDNYSYRLTGVYVDATDASSLGTNILPTTQTLTDLEAKSYSTFSLSNSTFAARNRIDLTFELGNQNTGSTKSQNKQINTLLKVYYELDDEPTSLTISKQVDAVESATTYTAESTGDDKTVWDTFIAGNTVDIGNTDVNPVITIGTRMGVSYVSNVATDGWTMTGATSKVFSKSILNTTYKIQATVTKVEAPGVTVDESSFSFEGPGYPVTVEGNGTKYIKCDNATGFTKIEDGKTYYAIHSVEAYAVDGEGNETAHTTKTLANDFDASKPFAAFLYESDYSSSSAGSNHDTDKVYQAIASEYNVVDVTTTKDNAKTTEILDICPSIASADLLVISELVSGSTNNAETNHTSAMLLSIKNDLVGKMNILNMKMFTYGSSQKADYRWGWGLPINYNNGTTISVIPKNKMLKVLNGVVYNVDDSTFPLWTDKYAQSEHIQPTWNFQTEAPDFTELITVTEGYHVLHYHDYVETDDAGTATDTLVYVAFGINANDYTHYHDNLYTIVKNICQLVKSGTELNEVMTAVPDPLASDNGDGAAKIVTTYNLATTYYKAYDTAPETAPTADDIIRENNKVVNSLTDKFSTDKIVYAVSDYEGLTSSNVVSTTVKGNTRRVIQLTYDADDDAVSGIEIDTAFTLTAAADSYKEYTVPYNTSFRKDGYTVTKWLNTRTGDYYTPGTTIQAKQDLLLQAVWTANTHKLTDLSSETEEERTVTWSFLQSDGAPKISVSYDSKLSDEEKKAFLVGQVHFADGTFMDVVLDIDASSSTHTDTPYSGGVKSAKFDNNDSRLGDVCQINNDTRLSFPTVYGMQVIYKGDADASQGKTYVSGSKMTNGTLTNPVYTYDSSSGAPVLVNSIDETEAAARFATGGIFDFNSGTATRDTLVSLESTLQGDGTWNTGCGYMKSLSVVYPALYDLKYTLYPEVSAWNDNEAPATITYAAGYANTVGKYVAGDDVEVTIAPAYGYKASTADDYITGYKEGTYLQKGDSALLKVTIGPAAQLNVQMTEYSMFTYSTDVSPILSGSVTVSSGHQGSNAADYTKYAEGTTLTFTAAPKVGYKFDHWMDPSNSNAAITLPGQDEWYENIGITKVKDDTLQLTVGKTYNNICNNKITYTAVFKSGKPGVTKYDIGEAVFMDGDTEETGIDKSDFRTEGFPESVRSTAIVLPKYYTLYKKGYTLDHWICTSYTNAEGAQYADGAGTENKVGKTYNIGEGYYFDNDEDIITLKPVFVKNTANFDYRTEETTLQWDFRYTEFAQTIDYDMSDDGDDNTLKGKSIQYSTHATTNGCVIDVPITIYGAFNTKRLTEWGRIGEGTDITIPSGKGATFLLATRSPISDTNIDGVVLTDWGDEQVTIDGSKVYVYKYTTQSPSTTVTLHVGSDFGYYKYLRAILPSADAVKLVAAVNNPAMGGLVIHKVMNAYNTDDITATVEESKVTDVTNGTVTYTMPLGSLVTLKTNRNHYYQVDGWLISDTLTCEKGDTLFAKGSMAATADREGITYTRTFLTSSKDTEEYDEATYGVRHENQLMDFRMTKYEQTVETVFEAYDTYQMTFTTGDDAEGEAPGVQIIEKDETFNIPNKNTMLYYQGHTLMYWEDEEATGTENTRYYFGKTYTPGKDNVPRRDITLTPVFEVNKFFLKDIESATTATWNLAKNDGAPTLYYQNSSGILVTQIYKDSEWIDLKIDLNSSDRTNKLTNLTDSTCCTIDNGVIITVPTTGDCDVRVTPSNGGMIQKTTICGSTNYTSETNRVDDVDMNTATYNYKGTTINGKTVAEATQDIVFNDQIVTNFHDISVIYNKVSVTIPEIEKVTVGTGQLPTATITDLVSEKKLSGIQANMQNTDEMPQVAVELTEATADYGTNPVEVEQATVDNPKATIYLKTNGGQLLDVYEIEFTKKTSIIKPQVQTVQVDSKVAQQQADGCWLVADSKPVGSSGLISVAFDRIMKGTAVTSTTGTFTIDASAASSTLSFTYWDAPDGTYTVTIDKDNLVDNTNETNTAASDLVIKFTVKADAQESTRRLVDFVVTDSIGAHFDSNNPGVVLDSGTPTRCATDLLIANLKVRGIQYGTINEGIALANGRDLYQSIKKRYYIYVPKGTYQLCGDSVIASTTDVTSGVDNNGNTVNIPANTSFNNGMTVIRRNNVSIVGEDRDNTILWNKPYMTGQKLAGTFHTFQGTNNFYAQDITFENRWDYKKVVLQDKVTSSGHAPALWDQGKKTILRNVALRSWQSTYYSQFYNSSDMSPDTRVFLDSCLISGISDPIYGDGDIWFEKCTLELKDYNGVNIVSARQTSGEEWGYVFNKCEVTGESASAKANNAGKWTLARPKENSPAVTYLHSTFHMLPTSDGYHQSATESGNGLVLRMHEYDSWSLDDYGNRQIVDLSERSLRNSNPGTGSLAPVMTSAEADAYTIHAVLGGTDAYDPESLSAQRPAVKGQNDQPMPEVYNDTLKWADDPDALCYFIYKTDNDDEDGEYKLIDITTEDTLAVERYGTCWFKIRAANQRGGLGKFTDPIHAKQLRRGYKAVSKTDPGDYDEENGKKYYRGWATICLPFNAKVPDDITVNSRAYHMSVYAVTKLEDYGNRMYLKKVERMDSLRGYVLHADVLPKDTMRYVFKEVQNNAEIQSILDGNPDSVSVDASSINCFVLNYRANYGVGFFKFVGDSIAPRSAWLSVSTMEDYDYEPSVLNSSAAKNMKMNFIFEDDMDNANAIQDVVIDRRDDRIYDLSGCRVTTPVKGRVYIINGIKVLWTGKRDY